MSLTYADCLELTKHLKRRKLANNTYLHTESFVGGEKCYSIYLHGKRLCTINPDGTRSLRDGGWLSRTTKARLNRFCCPQGACIYQKDYRWYYTYQLSSREGRVTIPFYNDMKVSSTTCEVLS